MKVCVRVAGLGETVRQGQAIDLREFEEWDARGVDVVADAVRSGDAIADEVRNDAASDCLLAVDCADSGPAHEHVGAIATGVTLSRRAALAAAARSRGHTPPQADELAAVRDRLDALDPPAVDLSRARERVADASDAEVEWRERVATLQGRVQALREADADLGDAEGELAEATRRLSEVETERIAAEQALARASERARDHRETRRERLRLEDRAGNLRRAAREHLADCVTDDFDEARDVVPDAGHLTGGTDALGAGVADALPSEVRDALAVARVADLDAPVALARDVDPFETPEEVARWLDAPVLRV